jgi:hypothetical protein
MLSSYETSEMRMHSARSVVESTATPEVQSLVDKVSDVDTCQFGQFGFLERCCFLLGQIRNRKAA